MRPGVDADVERRPGRIEDLRFTGSNVCDCGGLFAADVPSYYQYNEVMIIYNSDITYHRSSPLFHHERSQGHRITCSSINIGIASVMIVCIFLLQYSPETS
jgi:hypothetical protein